MSIDNSAMAVGQPGRIGRATATKSPEPALFGEEWAETKGAGHYSELRKLVKEKGLLETQTGYYFLKIVSTLALLAIGIFLLIIADNLWVQLANAVFMGVVFAQIGFIGHDSGHYQIARSARRNEIVGLVVTSLIALDFSWWVDKHNRHHLNPNQMGADGDIDVSVLAFTEDQARSKQGILRLLVRHQAILFFPITLLAFLSFRFGGLGFMIRGGKVKYLFLESLFVVVNTIVYLGLIYYFLGPWNGTYFLLVHQAVTGFFIANAFAPNHKGMPVVDEDASLDFLTHQTITTRNIKPNPVVGFLYGGLNYQIEHHLFPNMPRNNLGKARKVVKDFCYQHSVSYHETSVIGSNIEIIKCLNQASRPLREKRTSA